MSGNIRGPRGTRITAHNERGDRPRRIWFGPGTVMALLALAFILVVAEVNHRADVAASAGPVTYEADSGGHLRQVGMATRSALPAPTRPLWKPEVELLLERGGDLRLSASQKTRIMALDRAWKGEKANLDDAMRQAAAIATNALDHPRNDRGTSLQVIRRGMGDYSELSREYDARRSGYWMQAMDALTPQQRTRVVPASNATAPAFGGRAQ